MTPAIDWRRIVRDSLARITDDPAHDEQIVDELAQHLAQRFEELTAEGSSESLAIARATAELADPARLARALRQAASPQAPAPVPPPTSRSPSMWRDLLQDLRYGVRMLARARGFALAAVLTLALGIGATTAIYSVVDAVLVRPVPFRELDRLTMVWETDRNTGTVREPASLPDYLDMKARSRQYDGLAAFAAAERTLSSAGGEPVRLPVLFVTHDFLSILGVDPARGRGFTNEEDLPGGPALALISERLWERQFRRDPDAVGRTVRLNDREVTIIGVVPADADFGVMQILRGAAYARGFADRDVRSRVDVWLPLQGNPQVLVRDTHPIFVIGRLAPGATAHTAQQEMTALMNELEATYRSNVARGAFIEPMSDVVFARVRGALWVLLAAVGFVLLIACVNVANLLLARGTVRLREIAVRSALGAVGRRLARQFAAENLVLTTAAAALGVGLAYAGLRALAALAPADIPRIASVSVNGTVLLVALAIAVATGLVFGMVPLLQSRRLDVQSALKADDARGATAGRDRGLMRSTLVVSEVALAVVLVIGAGLLIKSFWRLSNVDAGFDAAGVLKAEFQLPASRYPAPGNTWPNFVEVHRFNDALLGRISALPGVTAAAIVGNHPVDPGSQNSWRVVGREEEGRAWPEISVRRVSPGYFATVNLAVSSGRPLRDADGSQSPPVTLINETTARRFFQGREPVGQQIALWGAARTIVGVVRDERIHGLSRDAPPALYLPYAQAPSFNGAEALLVRTTGDAMTLAAPVRAAVREIDPGLAVFGVAALSETVSESVAQQRFLMLLLVTFAGVALALAGIGIHGLLSYTVAQRRHELGIRMALGAPPRRVTRLVLRQGAGLTALGLVAGVAAAIALTRVLSTLLYGVTPTDAATFAVVLPVLGAVALLATWLPARRAVRIDPLQALRE
jgi:putative ABC transport system permease protein